MGDKQNITPGINRLLKSSIPKKSLGGFETIKAESADVLWQRTSDASGNGMTVPGSHSSWASSRLFRGNWTYDSVLRGPREGTSALSQTLYKDPDRDIINMFQWHGTVGKDGFRVDEVLLWDF